jgi:hypothetical protein
MDRTIVSKHTFGRSKSTGKIVGHREVIYSDSPGVNFGMTTNMFLFAEGENKLVIVGIPGGGYTDHFVAGGKYKPGTSATRTEIVVKDGKVTRTTVSETFDVDPDTLKMTPTGEKTTTISIAELGDGK